MPPLPLRTHPKVEEESPGRFRRWKWLFLLLILLIVWQTWRMVSSGRNLAKARDMQTQMANANLSPEQRQQLFRDMRTTMANLTPDQRRLLSAEQQKRQEQNLDRYFAMNKAEQRKYLDDRINQMQQMMKNANGSRPGAGQTKGTMPASFGTNGGKGPGGKGMTPDEIESRKKQRLDNTTADFRAKNDRFRKELDQRMKDRGIPPPPGGRR